MGAVLYWVRSDLRRRRAVLGLAFLVALASIVPLTAATAARRTDSALDRMRDELLPAHGDVQFEDGDVPPRALERIAGLPGVESVGEGVVILAHPVGSGLEPFEAFGQSARGDLLLREFERLRIAAGRMPEAADEVLVSTSLARQMDLDLGGRFEIETFTPEGLMSFIFGESFGYDGPVVTLSVVGVGETTREITGGGEDAVAPSFVVSEAFLQSREEQIGWFDGVMVVRHRDGLAGMSDLEPLVRAEFPDRADVSIRISEEEARIRQAVDAQTLALWLLAVVSAAAGLVAIGQAVGRFAANPGAIAPVLGALGLGTRERSAGRALAALVPVGAGFTLASAGAIAVSGAFPTGAARRIEPDPGPFVDQVVVALGAMLILALAAIAAARGPRRPSPRPRLSTVDRWLEKASIPVAASSGLRASFARSASANAAPGWSAMAAGAAGVAGALAALVFGASLDRLIDTPARYGWNWDYDVGLGDGISDEMALSVARGVQDLPGIESAMVARIDNIVLEGREEFVFARSPVVGELNFSVVEGRAAERPGEVALGATTMEALDVVIGDTVSAAGAGGEDVELAVVGQVLFPVVENEDPARGASMSLETYERLDSPGAGFPEMYVQAAAGADLDALEGSLGEMGFIATDVSPPAVHNLRGAADVPYAMAAFLALLAAVASAHALSTALRLRRRELAVLKTLGLTRRQIATTVIVQALAFAGVGLAFGLPWGLAIGRHSWRLIASGLGFATDSVVTGWFSIIVPATSAAAVLVAAHPARSAARTPPAELLRSE